MSDANETVSPAAVESTSKAPSVLTAHFGRMIRYMALVVLLVAALLAVAFFYRDCVEVVTKAVNGDLSTVTTCGPPTVSSGPLLVLLLVVLGLLWPDLAEVTVLGVGLKRQVEAAKNAVEATQGRIGLLEQSIQVQNLHIQTLASSSASNYTVLNLDGRFLNAERAEEIRELVKATGPTSAAEAADLRATSADPSASDETLKLEILANWERLSGLVGLARWKRRDGEHESAPEFSDESLRYLMEEFVEDHERSIQLARSLRNSVAHARSIDRSTLMAGANLLGYLVRSAEDHLESPAAGHA